MKIKIITISLAVIALSLVGFTVLNKKSPSLVYIDLQKTIKEFAMTKEYNAKMEFTDQKRQQLLDSLRFDAEMASRQLLNDSTNLNLRETFFLKRDIFLKRQEQFTKDQQAQLQEYNELVLKQVNQYVVEFRNENGYPIILGASGDGGIMASDPAYDVTDKFVASLNQRYNGKK